jgi:hypothetical protein
LDEEEVGVTEIIRGNESTKKAPFHRVEMKQGQPLMVKAGDKPTAIWIPAGYEIGLMVGKDVVLDISEVVEHDDIVSLDQKLREMKRAERSAKASEKRARRRLRRGGRPEHRERPKTEEEEG